jgi:5-methylcytosine-specific restriction endonuclease McrA
MRDPTRCWRFLLTRRWCNRPMGHTGVCFYIIRAKDNERVAKCRQKHLAARTEYDRQRRSTESYRQRENELSRERYATDVRYREAKLSRARSRNQNVRAKHLGLPELKLQVDLVDFLMNRDGPSCALCGNFVDISTTERRWRPSVDHVIPLSKGGAHTLDNLQLAHYRCNSSKRADYSDGTSEEA